MPDPLRRWCGSASRSEPSSHWVASMSAFVKEKTVVECASNWLCNESRVEGKGRGAILGLASTNYAHPGSVHCLRLRKPRLQSVRTFSYQVIDGWRLRADQCVPCASMARCMSYCNVHQPCRGFTCSRTHGTCYAAIDYTPQFSTSGVQMQKPHPRWRQFCGGVLRDGILLPQVHGLWQESKGVVPRFGWHLAAPSEAPFS